jgi:hypothetical protein
MYKNVRYFFDDVWTCLVMSQANLSGSDVRFLDV